MATNRLYIVNKDSYSYVMVAKCIDFGWLLGNVEFLDELLGDTCGLDEKTPLIFITENDDELYEKYIINGYNLNESGKWNYY